jgi:hypothetical protein
MPGFGVRKTPVTWGVDDADAGQKIILELAMAALGPPLRRDGWAKAKGFDPLVCYFWYLESRLRN